MGINIRYDSTGKPLIVHVQVGDDWAQTPFVAATKTMDWSLINYPPTRIRIKDAWDTWAVGKNLAIELQDRPDLAVNIIQLPDYDNWAKIMGNNTAYNNALNGILGLGNLLNARAIAKYENALDILCFVNAENRDRRTVLALISRWNDIYPLIPIINKPSAAQVTAWNVIADNNSMPFNFNTSTVAMALKSGF